MLEPSPPTSLQRSAEPSPDEASLDRLFEAFLRQAGEGDDPSEPGLREWVELAEAWRIAHALRRARGNRSAAARALGIGRRTLYSKMEKLAIAPTFSSLRRRQTG